MTTSPTRASSKDRWGRSIFCEDVRLDTTGQFHLIGCYAGGIIPVRQFPAMLPKLGLWIEVQQAGHMPIVPMEVKGYLPGSGATEPFFTSMLFDDGEQEIVKPPMADPGLFPGEVIHRSLCASITSPVRITASGRIIVRGFIGDEYYALGSIAVVAKRDDQSETGPM